MEKLNLSNNNLKKFGIIMGLAFLIITLFILLKHKHSILFSAAASALFFTCVLIAPSLLKPIYIIWMRFAFVLSWVNTRLILLIIFYSIFTPIALVLRLFGTDLLDKKLEKNKSSYWKKKEHSKFNPLNYERQF